MGVHQIKAGIPGVFYRRPTPDSANYKEDGTDVKMGDAIGLIEVMKSFHEIKADATGANIRFLVDSGDAVMAGDVLAEISI